MESSVLAILLDGSRGSRGRRHRAPHRLGGERPARRAETRSRRPGI